MPKFEFSARTMTVFTAKNPEGKTFPVCYEIQDAADMKRGQSAPVVRIYATADEKTVPIDVPADDEYYTSALHAAQSAAEEPAPAEEAPAPEDHSAEEPAPAEEAPAPETDAAEPAPAEEAPETAAAEPAPAEETPETAEAAEAAETPEDRSAEEPAPAQDPKQAHGPVPEKTFVGTSIKGARFEIVFDAEAQRTRVIIPEEYRAAARETVENSGFYFSASMDSWNRKLTFRAYRAAVALAAELEKLFAA